MLTSLTRTSLALAACLALTGCGQEAAPTTPSSSGGGADAPAVETALTPRATPLSVGDVAPGLDALDAERKVVVFYRGSW